MNEMILILIINSCSLTKLRGARSLLVLNTYQVLSTYFIQGSWLFCSLVSSGTILNIYFIQK